MDFENLQNKSCLVPNPNCIRESDQRKPISIVFYKGFKETLDILIKSKKIFLNLDDVTHLYHQYMLLGVHGEVKPIHHEMFHMINSYLTEEGFTVEYKSDPSEGHYVLIKDKSGNEEKVELPAFMMRKNE